jgi:cell division protein FtsL
MGATEYALRKVVHNNPIVHEIDEVRQREMWQWVWVGVVLVLVLLVSAWLHFGLVQHGYRMEKLQQARAAEEEMNRHLRLDIETLSSPKRIEDFATTRLQMIAPGLNDAIVLPRVVPPERPPSSVVAAR